MGYPCSETHHPGGAIRLRCAIARWATASYDAMIYHQRRRMPRRSSKNVDGLFFISQTKLIQIKYVYILQSITFPDRFYTGSTTDLKRRLAEHNQGKSVHSNKYAPWRLKTYLAFNGVEQAFAFECYLKTSSGRAFAIKRL